TAPGASRPGPARDDRGAGDGRHRSVGGALPARRRAPTRSTRLDLPYHLSAAAPGLDAGELEVFRRQAGRAAEPIAVVRPEVVEPEDEHAAAPVAGLPQRRLP